MNTTPDRSLTQTAETIGDLLLQSTRLGLQLLETLAAASMADVKQTLTGSMSKLKSRSACGCEIPPPCWAPVSLGEVTSHVCPGGTASIRIRVTNCDVAAATIHFDASGKDSTVTITPATLSLGPMERGVAVASQTVPATAGHGQTYEQLIWVRGCRTHYLRWTVTTSSRGVDCCHEIDVDDCMDQVHHWYDHFYCPRPCAHRDSANRQ